MNQNSEKPRQEKQPYHHGNLRRALIEAAREILVEQGKDALSLREVARQVGVSQTAPYHHFKNKEALLAAVAAQSFRDFDETMIRFKKDSDTPEQRLVSLGLAYVEFARRHPAAFRLMFSSQIKNHAAYPELVNAGAAAYEHVEKAVSDLIRQNGGDAKAIEGASQGAWALAHGLATLFLEGAVLGLHNVEGQFESLAREICTNYVLGVKNNAAHIG